MYLREKLHIFESRNHVRSRTALIAAQAGVLHLVEATGPGQDLDQGPAAVKEACAVILNTKQYN